MTSYDVFSRKDVPFGMSLLILPIYGGHIPPKKWRAWIGIFKPNSLHIKTCMLSKLLYHVLRKEDTDCVKKCIEYEVEGSRPRGRPKRTWREVVQKDCQARNLNREDAMDRSRWKNLIKIRWWSGWWNWWMFTLVPAQPCSPGERAAKRL